MKSNTKKRGQKIEQKLVKLSSDAKTKTREHVQENLIERLPNVRRVRIFVLEWVLLITIIISLAITQAIWYRDEYAVNTYTNGGSYIEATLGKVNSLNPLFANTNSEKALSKLMFATLSTIDYSGHVGLGLAKSISPDATGKVWTVSLKDNLKWSDGEPITAEDIVYTISLIQNASLNSIYLGNFSGVVVELVDDSVVFTLPNAYADFDATLNIPLVPKHILENVQPSQILESSFSMNPITSGAFRYNALQNVSTGGAQIVYLAANPDYYRGRPMLDIFTIRAYETTSEIIEAINTGAATATAELSALDSDKITAPTVYERETSIASGVFMFLNTESEILRDKSVRQAVRQGIDMAAVREELNGEAALDLPVLKNAVQLDNYPRLPEYNLDEARNRISATGVTSNGPVVLASLNTGYLPELGAIIKTQLELLGFTVEFTTYEPGQDFLLNVVRARNYDILLSEIELGAEPDLFPYYHSSQRTSSGLNLSKYSNSLVDDAILSARATLNPTLRKTRYENILRNWVEDVPAIGIYQANLTYFLNKEVRAFSEDNTLVYAVDRFGDVENWASEKTVKNRTP